MSKGLQDPLEIGGAQLRLQRIVVLPEFVIDEITLVAGDVSISAGPGKTPAVKTGETHARVLVSEANLNAALTANTPQDIPVKGLKLSVLSGRLKMSARFMNIPISIEGVPRIENGVRIKIAWKAATLVGMHLPTPIVDALEQRLNRTVDLSAAPIPIWLDEIVCEPGRITAAGRLRLTWPPDTGDAIANPLGLPRTPMIIAPTVDEFEDEGGEVPSIEV